MHMSGVGRDGRTMLCTCEGWGGDGRTMLCTCEGWGGMVGPCYAHVRVGEGMRGPCYAHVRGGEGIEGVAGAVHVIPPWCLFLLILPDAPDLARSQKPSSLDR